VWRFKMKNVGLFRHGAKLVRRSQGPRVEACGVPTIFEFEATNLEVKLHSFGETSPFHDLPDGAGVYVEVGVDMDWVRDKQPDVAKAVEDFVRHGRRPKFGPPLVDQIVPGDLDAPRDEPELLRCPFCGGNPHLTSVLRDGYADYQDDPDARAYFYVCHSCAAEGGWGKSKGTALRCWNMRLK